MIKILGRLRGTTEKVELDEVRPSEVAKSIRAWSTAGYIVSTSA